MIVWYCVCSFVLGGMVVRMWYLFRPVVTLEKLRHEASQRFPPPPERWVGHNPDPPPGPPPLAPPAPPPVRPPSW